MGQNPTMAPEFRTEETPPYGEVEQVSPLVRRVVANNPSRFTYHGSGTFIVGPATGGDVAIIDPGPADDDHVAALLSVAAEHVAEGAVENETSAADTPLALDA